MSHNSVEFILILLALAKIGSTASLINTSLKGDALSHSLKTSDADFIIASEHLLPFVQEVVDEQSNDKLFYIHENNPVFHQKSSKNVPYLFNNEITDKEHKNLNIEHHLDDVIMHIFTSGSTGFPKAALQTNRRWAMGYAGLGTVLSRLDPDDKLYVCLPFYHGNAVLVSLSACVSAGAAFIVDQKFSRSQFWNRIRQFDATAFAYIGEICNYLLSTPESSQDTQHRVKKAIGNGLKPNIWEQFQRRFDIPFICEFYGASESPLSFANVLYLPKTAGMSTLSYAIVEYDFENEQLIRNKKGFLTPVKKGETGLLIARKEKTFSGYSDGQKNENILIKDAFKKGDCWVDSGDLVTNMGFNHIQFADRGGDSYRWKGENTSASEVEKYLEQVEGVEKAAVFGIQLKHYDGKAGFAALKTDEFDPNSIYQHLNNKMAKASAPIFIRLVNDFETTETHKIIKTGLKQMGYQEQSDDVWIIDHDNQSYRKITRDDMTCIEKGTLNI